MSKILFANAQTDLEAEYYIGQKIRERWLILETAGSAYRAFIARNLIISRDQGNGIIKPETDYKVFQKGLNKIQVEESQCN